MHRDCALRSQTLVRSSAVTVISRPRDYVYVLRPRIFYTPPPATLSSVRADCLSFNRLTVPTTPSYPSAERTGSHTRADRITVIAHHQQPRFNGRFPGEPGFAGPSSFSPPLHMLWVRTFRVSCTFLRAKSHSWHQTNSVKTPKETIVVINLQTTHF